MHCLDKRSILDFEIMVEEHQTFLKIFFFCTWIRSSSSCFVSVKPSAVAGMCHHHRWADAGPGQGDALAFHCGWLQQRKPNAPGGNGSKMSVQENCWKFVTLKN